MKIDFANLGLQYQLYKAQINKRVLRVLEDSKYIMGPEIEELESALKEFTSAKNCITCSSGTDALTLAMLCLGIKEGDEIITTPFSYVATADTIAMLGAKPVFVDIDPRTFNIDANQISNAITENTKAIMPVNLFGQPADIDHINFIAIENNLKVIIDGAQSFGSTYKENFDSNLGDYSTTSFFPAKPLGCYGDGGAIFTNNEECAERIKKLRVHGQEARYSHKYLGIGARMDTVQAAVLLVKLEHYKSEIKKRQDVANLYTKLLKSNPEVITPKINSNNTSVWAQYTLRVKSRESIQNFLKQKNIPTAIHYPKPLNQQECFSYLDCNKTSFNEAEKACKEVLSIPMNPFLTVEEIEYVAEAINEATLN